MNDCWIVVADGAYARFMALEHRDGVPARSQYHLVESAHLSNPDHTVSGRRSHRKIKSGRDTGRGTLAPHGYSDHRNAHEAEILRRFAVSIAAHAAKLVTGGKNPSIIVVAEARMLSLLRKALAPTIKAGTTVRELAHDYTGCTASELCQRLAEHDLLPSARRQ